MTIQRRLALGDLLAVMALILAAVSAVAGLIWPGLYRDNAQMTAQARGTDLATLLVAIPVLGIGLWRSRRGSLTARTVVIGMLGYLVYAYAIFAFQVVINPATPAYMAILGLSSWSLVLYLPVLRMAAGARVGARLPRRLTAGLLGLIALAFAGLWLSEIAGAITSGVLPASVSDLGLPTAAVYTLDLAFLLPAMVLAAGLLVKRNQFGPPLALALLVLSVAMVLSIVGLLAFQAMDGMTVDASMAIPFAVIGLLAAVLAVAGLRPSRSGRMTRQEAATG